MPDIALQASSRTGALVYLTLPPDGNSGLICNGVAVLDGLVRHRRHLAVLARVGGTGGDRRPDQGRTDVGFMNQKLYNLAANPATYASDFFDVTTGNNTDSRRRARLPRRDRAGIR